MKNTYLLIIFSYFLFIEVSFCQEFQLKNITEDQGLSSSTVWTIAQDKEGYIWFGTSAGLDRYDGKEFKHYSTKDGLPENEVLEIFTDVKSNRLYLQTFSNSFCYYENGEIINEKKNPELKKFKSKRTQTKVKFDGTDVNNQFIYTDSTYYLLLDSSLKYKEKYTTYNVGELMKFYYYKGQLFALIDDGKDNVILIKAYKNSKYQIVKKWDNIHNPELLIKSIINNMFIIYDEKNNIFFYNKEDLKLEKVILAKTEITSVCVDRDSLFWYGKNDGIYYSDIIMNGSEHHQILKGIIITNLFEDNLGNLWVGTLDNGVFLLTNKKIKNKKNLFK